MNLTVAGRLFPWESDMPSVWTSHGKPGLHMQKLDGIRSRGRPWLPPPLVNGPTMWPVQASSATMGLRHVLWAWCRPNIWLVLHLSRRFFRWCPSLWNLSTVQNDCWLRIVWDFTNSTTNSTTNIGDYQNQFWVRRVLPHTFAVSKVLSSSTASFLTFLQLKHEVRGMGFSSILRNGSSMSSMLQVWIQHSGKCWRRGIIQLSTPHWTSCIDWSCAEMPLEFRRMPICPI